MEGHEGPSAADPGHTVHRTGPGVCSGLGPSKIAAMDTLQKVLPFRRFVVLPNGQQATVLPKTKPISGFVCSICHLGFKTRQGLKGRILPETAVSVVTSGNVATLLLATSSSVTEPADASTPVESLGASSSTSSPASIPTAAGLREAKKTRRKKIPHVKVNRPKLTRGAAKRCKWSVMQQADVIEVVFETEAEQRFATVAEKLAVSIGNISRWWQNRDAILQRADELRQRMLLGLKQRQHSDRSSSLKIHWKYNQSLEPLLKRLETEILNRQNMKRLVKLGFVKRTCTNKIVQITHIGITPTFRGEPLIASTTWWWRVMMTLGYTSRRRSKIRPTSIDAAVVSMSQWLSFFRDVVIRPLPNQAIENMDTEHEVVPQEPEHEDPIAIGPKGRYRKRMRVLPIAPKIPIPVSRADWGRYPPHMRYNCDQVPFNLDNSGRNTYIKAQNDVAVISGPPGSEKRFGTLQVCLHVGLTTSQPPLTLLFRGAGPANSPGRFPGITLTFVYFGSPMPGWTKILQ